ncbi:MAG: SDR family NAD(P)-dependent oxidoreductase [Deltaproteobacteria bacterium]|nr:SDR family NAD(P)-dependent oxidoreductase [Deltaproteobacteria bacterium]
MAQAQGPVAVIAGVGPGIGARFVETFAQEGYRVVGLARNASSLDQIRTGLGKTAERCVFWPTDITDDAQVKQTFARVRKELGPINLLVCNAGGGAKRGSFLDVSANDFMNNLKGQVYGPFLCAKEAIPDMLANGGGTVAYIGATSSVKGYGKSSAFATGKFALRALAQCNAREFGAKGIHVFHVIIDGGIDDVPFGEEREVKPGMLDSRSIARVVAQAVAQPRDTWVHEFDIRPSVEQF